MNREEKAKKQCKIQENVMITKIIKKLYGTEEENRYYEQSWKFENLRRRICVVKDVQWDIVFIVYENERLCLCVYSGKRQGKDGL